VLLLLNVEPSVEQPGCWLLAAALAGSTGGVVVGELLVLHQLRCVLL
jgi:hypothetical protein